MDAAYAKAQDPRSAISLLKRKLAGVKERLRSISNKLSQEEERELSPCTGLMTRASLYPLQLRLTPPETGPSLSEADLRIPAFPAGSRGLTICLRNVIRRVLGGLRSSLLSLTSVGSGVASPPSLRSTVCKVESTSSDFTTSTGDSHTTWIILPGNKTVKRKTHTFPKTGFIK